MGTAGDGASRMEGNHVRRAESMPTARRLQLEMCQARNGKKQERERNGKGTRSFLSRSSIFGHPFFSRFWPKS